MGLSPHHLTVGGLFAAIAAAVVFVFSPFWGGVLILLSGGIDTLDGELSRLTNQSGKSGGFLDSVVDRYAEFFFVLGIWGHYQARGEHVVFTPLLCLLIVFGSLMVSYTHSRGLNFGISCSAGFFERPERVVFLGGGGILEGLFGTAGLLAASPVSVLEAVLAALAIGTHWTAWKRILHFLRQAHSIRGEM
jgi:phosphatidylglycerophosphate synthase